MLRSHPAISRALAFGRAPGWATTADAGAPRRPASAPSSTTWAISRRHEVIEAQAMSVTRGPSADIQAARVASAAAASSSRSTSVTTRSQSSARPASGPSGDGSGAPGHQSTVGSSRAQQGHDGARGPPAGLAPQRQLHTLHDGGAPAGEAAARAHGRVDALAVRRPAHEHGARGLVVRQVLHHLAHRIQVPGGAVDDQVEDARQGERRAAVGRPALLGEALGHVGHGHAAAVPAAEAAPGGGRRAHRRRHSRPSRAIRLVGLRAAPRSRPRSSGTAPGSRPSPG